MTERERDVLRELRYFTDTHTKGLGARPMDVGGFNGSHHGATLRRLAGKGLADAKVYRIGERRTSYYRISEAGREAIA